jgi:hypothetical protein
VTRAWWSARRWCWRTGGPSPGAQAECRGAGTSQAAWRYSWMSPPRTSTRSIRSTSRSAPTRSPSMLGVGTGMSNPPPAADVRGFVDVRMGSLREGTPGRFFEGGHPLDIAAQLERPVVIELESITNDQDKAFLMGCVLPGPVPDQRPRCSVHRCVRCGVHLGGRGCDQDSGAGACGECDLRTVRGQRPA